VAKFLLAEKLPQKIFNMKKEHSIRTLLGLTQEDCARILQVTRSQWSMFELGQRDLPLAAKQLLAELLTHVQSPETLASRHPAEAQHEVAKKALLERMLCENEYQQLRIAKKVSGLTKKYEAKIKVLKLVDYMVQRPTGKVAYKTLHLNEMVRSASTAMGPEAAGVLLQLQIKQEGLALEKLLLESKMQKLRVNTEKTGDLN